MDALKLGGMLGMFEMEMVVARMLEKAEGSGVSFEWLTVTPGEFQGMELVGFCQLCVRGLIDYGYPNSEFHPRANLVRIVNEFLGTNYGTPPSLIERFGAKMDLLKKEECFNDLSSV